MEVTLTPEQEAALDRLTDVTGKGRSSLVQEAVERYLEEEHRLAVLRAEVQIGIDQLERGEYTEYTEETLHELFDEICREGWQKLAQPKRSA